MSQLSQPYARPRRGVWRFLTTMAADDGKAKGYANRTHEFVLVIKSSYRTMSRCSSFHPRHLQVSCVQQELNMTCSFVQLTACRTGLGPRVHCWCHYRC